MPSPFLGHSRRLLSSYALALTSLSRSISWNSSGRTQQTLASSVTRSGTALHSGNFTTVRLIPAAAGEGRYFVVRNLHSRKGTRIPASIDHVVSSALCTTLCRDGVRVRTVEHVLSALEACGVDNCRIEIDGGEEVPLLDGSAKQWVEAIKEAGLYVANDHNGCSLEKLVPKLHEPLYLWHGNSFLIAFPSPKIYITYGIHFSKIMKDGLQVEGMRRAGLIKGGSVDNAIVCSATAGWLNPPLRFCDEPCRHKVLDLVGDVSLFAQNGNQGLPIAHIIAYKAGHALHTDFVRLLSRSPTAPSERLATEKLAQ
ncbi:putative UDP-3-O-acyl-N-acetylglucosamine deacetylase 1, mitochondrial [Curcuma longa]|uniref:putative UDP-3-O-acyl-N-acetylglucosamine deacetylase 1, mitochondrial n=1 Tax=Curcuma longa TaxID=136217 RepID=UPI003D9F554A